MSESAATAVELLEHALTLLDREIPACLGAADFTADKMPVLGPDEPGPTLLTLLGQVEAASPSLLGDREWPMQGACLLATKIAERVRGSAKGELRRS